MSDQVAEIKSKVDIAQLINERVTLKQRGRRFLALCPFHSEKTPSFTVSPDLGIFKCFGCFPAGQLVKTPFGYHKIEEVVAGEYVFSGKGEIRKVLIAHQREYEGEVASVQLSQLSEPVTLTEDHLVYSIGGARLYAEKYKYLSKRLNYYRRYPLQKKLEKTWKYFPIVKVKAGELERGMSLLYPVDTVVADVELIDLSEYITKRWPVHGRRPMVPPLQIEVDEDLLKLLGYYIAEGSNHRAYIRFSLGNHEEELAKEIVGLIEKIFLVKAKIYRRPGEGKKTGLEVTGCNSVLANIFENLCGKGAELKHIPFVLQQLPKEKQAVLLEAIFKGDGYERLDRKAKTRRRSITTVSRVLSEQLTDILLRLGFFPSRRVEKEKEDKMEVHHKEAITVSWSIDPKASKFHHFYETDKGEKFWLLPISEVQKRRFSGRVYNLTVEKDHSYVANTFAVANCGKSGDVYTFLQEYEGMSFVEALEYLAEKTGVKLERRAVDRHTADTDKKIYEINHLAAEYFHYLLTRHKVGERGRQYLKSRAVASAAIDNFFLGYAPDRWDSIFKFLTKKGYPPEIIEQAGLIVSALTHQRINSSTHFYDRFRGRVIFPLRDPRGQTVGFAGRLLDPEVKEAKYINSPETPVYHKGRHLYGIFENRDAIRRADRAILVEGELDAISSWQVGVKNVLAVKGTALTSDQVRLVRRYTRNVSLALDADPAGWEALERSLPILEDYQLNLRVITFPPGAKDPDDIARSDPKNWRRLVDKAVGVYEAIVEETLTRIGFQTGEQKKTVSERLAPVLARIKNPVEQEHWINTLARRLQVSPQSIHRQISIWKSGAPPSSTVYGPSSTPKPSRQETLSKYLLSLLIQSRRPKPENLDPNWLFPVGVRRILELFNPKLSLADFRGGLPAELHQLFDESALLELGPGPDAASDPAWVATEIADTLRDLERLWIKQEIRDQKANPDRLSSLLNRLNQLEEVGS